jgi:PhnB protein
MRLTRKLQTLTLQAIQKEEIEMKVQSYINFDGRCEEALEFYKSAVGAQVQPLRRFSDAPPCPEGGCFAPGAENKVMHAAFSIGETEILASDGRNLGQPEFRGISLSLFANDKPEAERLFSALADGGQIQMPLTETFFSPAFGMLADRFGVEWMIIVAA